MLTFSTDLNYLTIGCDDVRMLIIYMGFIVEILEWGGGGGGGGADILEGGGGCRNFRVGGCRVWGGGGGGAEN